MGQAIWVGNRGVNDKPAMPWVSRPSTVVWGAPPNWRLEKPSGCALLPKRGRCCRSR